MANVTTSSKSPNPKKSSAAKARREANAAKASIRNLWITASVLLLIGLALSIELVRLHFAATSDPSYHSYCAVNETVSCDTVTRSKYSLVFGVPMAVWGVYGYAVMLVAAVLGLRTRSRVQAAWLTALAVFSLTISVILAALSHFRIHAWCLLCIGTYAVNAAATVVSFRLLAKEGMDACIDALLELFQKQSGKVIAIGGLLGGSALVIIALFPQHHASAELIASQPTASTAAPETSAAAPQVSAQPLPPLPPGVHVEHGVTSDGLHWIGAANPVITITEFFDYECSHCQQAYQGLHELLEMNPDRLRLVVRHYPLDPHCNRSMSRAVYEHSCFYAQLANCAGEQQRFWEAHEYLFAHADELIEAKAFAAALKLNAKTLKACLGHLDEALYRDIEAGIALEIHGTPVFVIDGRAYMQHLPQSVVERLRHP